MVAEMAYFSANHPEINRMNLLDILSPESTIVDLKGESKEDIIAELVNSLPVGDAITDPRSSIASRTRPRKDHEHGHRRRHRHPPRQVGRGDRTGRGPWALSGGESISTPSTVSQALRIFPAGLPGQCLRPPHQGAGADFALAQERRVQKKLIEAESAEEIIATIEAAERDIPAAN